MKTISKWLLALSLLTSVAHAQSPVFRPDSVGSVPVSTQRFHLPLDSVLTVLSDSLIASMRPAKSPTQKPRQTRTLDMQRIAVHVGDSISYSVQVFDQSPPRSVWGSIAKAIVPAIIVGGVTNQQTASIGEQKASTLPAIGVGIAMTPGIVDLLQQHGKQKTFIGLVARDSSGQQLATLSSVMTKAARKDWQQLTVTYVAKEDGFVELINHNPNEGKVIWEDGKVTIKRQNSQLQVAKYKAIDGSLLWRSPIVGQDLGVFRLMD